eukprot:comp25135_c0_seq1/m.46961 comp25135_c0_seq1/g.46961  ORF comp25135_c0_seq1/g.46961 comp25135_c0_seq1/m.46961 type:complete len:155 (-) comp25135_c0_seq1:468-932(-)
MALTMWGVLFYFLCAECVMLMMLLLPGIRRAFVWVVKRMPMNTIRPYFIVIGLAVLFCAGAAFKEQYEAHQRYHVLDPSEAGYALNHAAALNKKWRTERNSYIGFFAVYLWLAIVFAYGRACEHSELKQQLADAKKQTPGAPAAAKTAAEKKAE